MAPAAQRGHALAPQGQDLSRLCTGGQLDGGLSIERGHLELGPEREMYQEYRAIAGQPIENVISRLRPKVDLFFDKVLVNAPDATVRQNRLTLLSTLLAEFSTIADFSEIVTNS